MGTQTPQERFAEALDECNQANEALLAGRGAAIKNAFSHRNDTSLFGGFGGHEVGWAQIGPRLDWVARSFAGGSCVYDVLASAAGPELAYVVQFERGEAQLSGGASPLRLDFRVTMIFRWEDDAWKLVHRHADHLIEKQSPT
jgi:hypothetical protein